MSKQKLVVFIIAIIGMIATFYRGTRWEIRV